MTNTTPDRVGPQGVVVFFVLLYVVSTFVVHGFVILLGKLGYLPNLVAAWRLSRSAVVGFVPIFILALNSLGQLSARDILLIVGLACIGLIYLFRSQKL
jgi:hypothetical protein